MDTGGDGSQNDGSQNDVSQNGVSQNDVSQKLWQLKTGNPSPDQGWGRGREGWLSLRSNPELGTIRPQWPGWRRVRQPPLAVLTSTPIGTGPDWPSPWFCHQDSASAQAASSES